MTALAKVLPTGLAQPGPAVDTGVPEHGVREHGGPGTRRSRNMGQGTARVLPGRDRAVRLPLWRQGWLADAGLVTEPPDGARSGIS